MPSERSLPNLMLGMSSTSAQTKDAVDSPCIAYLRMSDDWQLILDLLGGTKAMRIAGERYLPRWEAEEVKQWQARRDRTFLYNAVRNTLRRMTSKPFSKPVTLKSEGLTDVLQAVADDVDGCGCDTTQFCRQLFQSALTFGLAHVFVDYTTLNTVDSEGRPRVPTLADEKAVNARPRFVLIEAPQLIGWRWEIVNGAKVLTQIRWREVRSEQVGNFGEQDVEYIWVVTPTDYQAYRRAPDSSEFTLDATRSGAHTFGRIPLLTLYFNKTAFMEAEPPLTDIAWLNVEHWQSSSDQRHILSMSRFAILFGKGFTEDQIKAGLTIGPARFVGTSDEKGDLKFVEVTGNAIKSGREDLLDLQQRMEVLGLQPMIARTKDSTATGKRIDEGRVLTDIQAWVRAEENLIYEAFQLAAEWVKQQLPEDFAVDIFSDFGIGQEDVRMFQLLLDACKSGKVSHLTFLQEAKRRGVLSESIIPEDEIDQIEAEGPPLGLVGLTGVSDSGIDKGDGGDSGGDDGD